MRELLDYTERRTRAELARLPHGSYEADGFVDNDGYTDEPVKLKARVTLAPDGAHFDTTGSDPQRRAPVNSTYAMTFSACAYMLKCLIDPDLPVNDGFYRLISLDAPAGTVTNGNWPGAVVGGWETHDRLVEVLFRAVLPALPERIPAGTKGMMCQAGFGSLDVEAGTYTCFYETFAGGYGGRATSDGPDAVQAHGQNTENAPIEETELNYPVRIGCLALVPDSDGAGRFRGGLGLRKDYRFDLHTTFTILADRDRSGPWGVFGHAAEAQPRLRDAGRDRGPPAATDRGGVVQLHGGGGRAVLRWLACRVAAAARMPASVPHPLGGAREGVHLRLLCAGARERAAARRDLAPRPGDGGGGPADRPGHATSAHHGACPRGSRARRRR